MIPTDDLWQACHRSLLAGRWSTARALLDDLSRRPDVRDCLGTARGYGVPEYLQGVIGDRIDAVNDRARSRR